MDTEEKNVFQIHMVKGEGEKVVIRKRATGLRMALRSSGGVCCPKKLSRGRGGSRYRQNRGIIGGGRKSLVGLQWLKSQTEVNQPRKGITVPRKYQERRMESNAGEFEVEEGALH